MFLYSESPEQKRNTLSHLTESIGFVFPNCVATFCSKDQFEVMEVGLGRGQKRGVIERSCLGEKWRRKGGGDKEGAVLWAGG